MILYKTEIISLKGEKHLREQKGVTSVKRAELKLNKT